MAIMKASFDQEDTAPGAKVAEITRASGDDLVAGAPSHSSSVVAGGHAPGFV